MTNYMGNGRHTMVQCRIYKDSLFVPILSRINPICRTDTHFRKINYNFSFQQALGLRGGFFFPPVGLSVKFLKLSNFLLFWLYILPIRILYI